MTNSEEKPEDPFRKFLSEEDAQTLEEIQKRLIDKLKQDPEYSKSFENKELPNIDASDPYVFDEINKPQHLSDQNRELIFYIRAELSTIDYEQQKYISLDHCYNESYHIPIPSGVDFKDSFDPFVETFEKTLGSLGTKLNKGSHE
jgi:hypothetical protein